jgi:hypothetical protein
VIDSDWDSETLSTVEGWRQLCVAECYASEHGSSGSDTEGNADFRRGM